jgi:DNA-binding SARP family transcriptional activator
VPISRQQLAFLFWPDSTDQQALKNLRTLLTRLRQALPDANLFFETTPQAVQWRPDAPFTLDVAEFELAIAQVVSAQEIGDYPGTIQALVTAVGAYTGDLLPNCYDDWILPLREHLHRAFGDALERLVLLLEEHRDYETALPYARRLLNHDPLREASYHHLIHLYLAVGDRTEALRICGACDTMLEREFGIAPERSTREMYERLLDSKDQTVPAAFEQAVGLQTSSLPLVGRKDEWSRLISAWRAAAAGHPQMILLSGDAGIGKTRLAEELCAWVARQGNGVAAAHCHPSGGSTVAYAPVVEWLSDPSVRTRLDALNDVWLVEIARILPSLVTERPHLKPPGPLTEAWQRTRLFEALARAVLGSDDQAPLLLFLDDLQWCDQETLNWLGYLLRFASRAPLLIVATVRKYEIDHLHPLMSFWLALTRYGLLTEIFLEPLDAEDTGQLAAHVAGRVIEASEASQIFQDTEGNPLFVVEMIRAGMVDEEAARDRQQRQVPGTENAGALVRKRSPFFTDASVAIPFGRTALPAKVRAVIQWRLAQLSPAAQAVVQAAAVIGRSFSYEMLVKVSGQQEETVIEALDELWQRHLVSAQGGATYNFSHDGIRAVAYDDTAPIRRSTAHLRLAQMLQELHQADLDPVSLQIAGHYEQAGQIQPAIAFYRQAASAAERIYANAEAAHLYQHLLESHLSQGLTLSEKCTVRLALAEVWRATGQWARAETISRTALADARALDDVRLMARARRILADVLHLLGYYDAALECLAEAEQGFMEVGDWRGVANTLWIAGEIYWLRGDHPQALTALERQLKIAAEINEPTAVCEALEAIGTVLWSQGDWARAAESCLKSILIAGPLEYKPVLARASITLGNIRAGEHWLGEAVYWYTHAGTLAQEIDDRQALSAAISSIALILAKRGDHVRALAGYERSLQIAWEIGDRWSVCLNVAGLAAIHESLGMAVQAETLYRQAVDFGLKLCIPSFVSGMLVNLSRFLLGQGRAEEARIIYQDALSQISGVTGERLAGEDTRFEAQVLGIRLRFALGELTRKAAEAELRTLLQQVETPSRLALLYYELWRLSPEDQNARAEARACYQTEYDETGTEESRRRYQELTGELLPDPPPLPDVSDLIPDQRETQDLARALSRLQALFE